MTSFKELNKNLNEYNLVKEIIKKIQPIVVYTIIKYNFDGICDNGPNKIELMTKDYKEIETYCLNILKSDRDQGIEDLIQDNELIEQLKEIKNKKLINIKYIDNKFINALFVIQKFEIN
jgi:hypothetical protein